jgi:adenine C2-methylase RlmN of 23S rRNA A2503 and tRNA A37
MYQALRQTIPYNHFKDRNWDYDPNRQYEELGKILEENGFSLKR